MNPILETALELAAAGYSVIPIRPDGTKAPAIPWKHYTTQRPSLEQIHEWFDQPGYDLAVIQGAISGGAELTEVEGRAAADLPDLAALAADTGLADLWTRVATGWTESSPSGGFHFHTRLTGGDVPGNTKLARGEDRLVLAETRGEHGYVIVAPSTHHHACQPWRRLTGSPATAAVLTKDERDAFHALIRTLDRTPAPTTPERPTGTPRVHDGLTPGDDYENQVDWTDILTPHGWTHVATRGATRYWLRPGGSDTGARWSASTGHADDRDRFFCWSSSTAFDLETPYTKLGAYAVLNHGGDHSAAARALARDGYGEPATRLTPADDLEGLIAPTTGDTTWTTPDAPAPIPPTSTGPTSGTASAHSTTTTSSTTTSAIAPGSRPPAIAEERPAAPNQDNTALLLVDRHTHEIRYTPGRGTWLTWNGHRWTNDDTETVREHARTIARRLPTSEGWDRYTKSALTANGISGILRLAQSDPRIVAPTPTLDARPYELNTPSGVVNLTTGTITPPDPTALHTRSTTIAPDLDGPHPLWDRFLADTFAGDPTMTTFIQRLIGLSAVGVVLEQIFPFAYGSGANGKTTLLSVIQHLLGMGETGYAMSAPASMLLASRSEGHPTELARLSGARLVVTSELEDSQRFAEAKIKLLTGKDTISGRFMRQDWFDFTPTHTLWLLANHQPEVRAGGAAFWRRIRLLPFEHVVPPEQRVPDLEDKLIEQEGPAILGWLIQGAADYFRHGLAEPTSVSAATAAYQLDQDTIARFVAECCETGNPSAQHMAVKSATLRAAYETWCRVEGEDPTSVKAMTFALRTRFGVVPTRSNAARYLTGIRLIDAPDDTDDASRDASHDDNDDERAWWNE